MTWAINWRSGFVIAKLRNNCFKLSGRFDLPAYPGFMVMKIAMSGLTLTCLLSSSQVIGVAAEKTAHLVTPELAINHPENRNHTSFYFIFLQ